MLTAETKLKIVERSLQNALDNVSRTKEVLAQVEKMELESGLNLVEGVWGYSGPFSVKLSDLKTVRKVCGPLTVEQKDVPYDFSETGEIYVLVRPKSEKWNKLSFRYRTKLRGRRCRVEKVVSEYQTLVCEV